MAQIHVSAALYVTLAGCASYERQPLDPDKVFDRVVADLDEAGDPATLHEAVDWMLARNPRIVAARVTWRTAAAQASVPTPLANPSFSIGPVLLSGGTWGFDAALGWALPLSGWRGIRDDRNAAQAEAARVQAIAAARSEYLLLRGDLLRAAIAKQRQEVDAAIAGALQRTVDTQRALGDRATLSALQLALFELNSLAQGQSAAQSASRFAAAQGSVARRCGVAGTRVAGLPMAARPEVPTEVPPLSQLRDLVRGHPDLVALRAQYETAEQQLRLQVRRQYPDLQLSPSIEREGTQNRFSLPLGISVPLFDRNRGPIAVARAVREGLRRRYDATARDRLGAVAAAHAAAVARGRGFAEADDRFEKTIRAARDLIDVTLRNGRMNATTWSQALQQLSAAQRSRLGARSNIYAAWLQLEQSCGAPLLSFPGAPAAPTDVENRR